MSTRHAQREEHRAEQGEHCEHPEGCERGYSLTVESGGKDVRLCQAHGMRYLRTGDYGPPEIADRVGGTIANAASGLTSEEIEAELQRLKELHGRA